MQTVFIWVWYGETQDSPTWQLYVPLSHEKCLFSHTTKSHTTQLPYICTLQFKLSKSAIWTDTSIFLLLKATARIFLGIIYLGKQSHIDKIFDKYNFTLKLAINTTYKYQNSKCEKNKYHIYISKQ